MALYPAIKKFLKQFKQDSGRIFIYKNKDSLRCWERGITKLKTEGRIARKHTMHQIRKTVATTLINEGMKMFDTMDFMRWKDLKTMKKYYALADKKRIGDEVNKILGSRRTPNLIKMEETLYKKKKKKGRLFLFYFTEDLQKGVQKICCLGSKLFPSSGQKVSPPD